MIENWRWIIIVDNNEEKPKVNDIIFALEFQRRLICGVQSLQ